MILTDDSGPGHARPFVRNSSPCMITMDRLRRSALVAKYPCLVCLSLVSFVTFQGFIHGRHDASLPGWHPSALTFGGAANVQHRLTKKASLHSNTYLEGTIA
jgi:hypothetical protein